MRNVVLLILLVLATSTTAVFPQENEQKWTRIQTDDGAFSASFPAGTMYDLENRPPGRKLRVVGFQNGVAMDLTVTNMDGAGQGIAGLPREDGPRNTLYKIGEFSIIRYAPVTFPRLTQSLSILHKRILYYIVYSSNTGTEPELTRFVNSIRLAGKPMVVDSGGKSVEDEIVLVSKLKTSPEITEARERKPAKREIKVTREIEAVGQPEPFVPGMTRRAFIVERPPPNAPIPMTSTLNNGISNRLNVDRFAAKLRVTMLADGQIGDIVVLGSNDKEFEKDCVSAAKKIRFVPAQINGVNSDSTQIVEYWVMTVSYPAVIRR